MVDLTRRKTVIGLGLLATGSGATFTSAAFASQVAPASDMRVVVGQEFEKNLRVEAGDIFRDGGASASYEADDTPSSAAATVKNLSNNNTEFFTSNTGNPNTDKLDEISVKHLPAAGANAGQNGGLELAVATKIDETETIGDEAPNDNGFIQIENNTPDNHNIGIRFDEFGEDVNTPSQNGDVTRQKVFDTYKFKAAEDDALISPDGFDSNNEQDVANALTVPTGETKQIYLEVDTEKHADSILDATTVADSPFNDEQDTVDLVDRIRVGTTAESINS